MDEYPIAYTFVAGLLLVDEDFGESEVDPRVVPIIEDLSNTDLVGFLKDLAVRGHVRDPPPTAASRSSAASAFRSAASVGSAWSRCSAG